MLSDSPVSVTCSCCRILLCQFACSIGRTWLLWLEKSHNIYLLVLPRKWTQFGFHSWLYVRRMRVVEYQTMFVQISLWHVWMRICVCSRLYRTVNQRQTVAKFPAPALLLLCLPQSRPKWRSPNHCKPLSVCWVCAGAWACKGWFYRLGWERVYIWEEILKCAYMYLW